MPKKQCPSLEIHKKSGSSFHNKKCGKGKGVKIQSFNTNKAEYFEKAECQTELDWLSKNPKSKKKIQNIVHFPLTFLKLSA